MFINLANEPSSTLSLGSTIQQAKIKHNNVFVNKLMSMMLDLSRCNIRCFYVYVCKNMLI